jgi:hypothetical protein
VLLVAAGIAFSVTATAYFVMALKGSNRAAAVSVQDSPVLLTFLDRYGTRLLTGELLVLGVATFGAIGTDSWRRS